MRVRAAGEGLIELGGTGVETRDYIHAADVARAALLGGWNPPAGNTPVYNVANGGEVTLRRAVSALLIMERRRTWRHASRARCDRGIPSRWCADIRRLQELGYSPSVSLETGLAKYREWFRGKGKQLK